MDNTHWLKIDGAKVGGLSYLHNRQITELITNITYVIFRPLVHRVFSLNDEV